MALSPQEQIAALRAEHERRRQADRDVVPAFARRDAQERLRAPAVPPALRPQEGFQEKFLASRADITIGGGAAGCGKTYAELISACRHRDVVGYSSVIFRRTTKQVKNPGGLWDEARKVYPTIGAAPNNTDLEWQWPSSKVKMAHLEHEDNVFDWQGAQVAGIIFDELTHFTAFMFWYMLSRNRSTCGVKPFVMATCNPDADSWVAELIAWWIDQDENSPTYGLPIPEREGVLRYFARVGDDMVWGDTPEQVHEQAPEVPLEHVKSLTFIPGKLSENKILERADPSYRANLMALSRVERERLLNGNWKARRAAGDVFRRGEVRMLDEVPGDVVSWVRRWDLAATEPSETSPDPDWTCGVKMGKRKNGHYVIAHVEYCRKKSDQVRELVRRTAENDGAPVRVGIMQDPGQAGVDQVQSYTSLLDGFSVVPERETGDKETRAEPFSAQWQHGNVDVVRGAWNSWYFNLMEGFPQKGVHDDPVDASSGAYRTLNAPAATFFRPTTRASRRC